MEYGIQVIHNQDGTIDIISNRGVTERVVYIPNIGSSEDGTDLTAYGDVDIFSLLLTGIAKIIEFFQTHRKMKNETVAG